MTRRLALLLLSIVGLGVGAVPAAADKPRVIVTSDAEIDDQCSLVRFLLYANEWDIGGIITTSSQYRWQGYKWPGDNWAQPYLRAYAQVYPNLIQHDPAYPTPEYLSARAVLGNAGAEGEMADPTPGSDLIAKVLLGRSDPRPVWLQAWGGVNTIARALRTIEEKHPERMEEVAAKCRLFLISEQDRTYLEYIRPVWGKYGILTIISDQFEGIGYRWKRAQPAEVHRYFEGPWMRANILRGRGPLTALYHAHENGDFRSEGDSPAFLHTIPTGLRSLESPDWGGWGGRYVRVRENTWLDPVPVPGYVYPEGRWHGGTAWGRNSQRPTTTSTAEQRARYFKPIWRWTPALQNDFDARAAWCVKSYAEANHPPVVVLAHPADLKARPGAVVRLSAEGSSDPNGDELTYRWWHYEEAGTCVGSVGIRDANRMKASFTIPDHATHGSTVHIICEVMDNGAPPITRYRRVVVEVESRPADSSHSLDSAGAAAIPPMTAHFPLDGADGTSVPETVHGLEGRLINASAELAWIAGVCGGAVQLDGRAARIVVPEHEGFDFGDESFSISFWMRWPAGLLPGRQRLLTKGDYDSAYPGETGRRYEILINSGTLRFTVDDNVTASRIQVPLAPFISGDWVHVAAIRDREAGRLRLYANGVVLPTSNPGNPGADGTDRTGSISNPRDLYLGDSSREDAPYHGGFDDLRFFRSALTDRQVAAIAARLPLVEQRTQNVSARPMVTPAPSSELPPMTAHFPLTEGEGIVVEDMVDGVTGMLENADPESAWTSSDRGLALRLDGVNDRLVVPNGPGFDFRDESFSVAFHLLWTKDTPPLRGPILYKGVAGTPASGESGGRWEIALTPRGLCFAVGDNAATSQIEVPHGAILTGRWVHITAVRNTKARRLELYIDGKMQTPNLPEDDRFNGVDRVGDISNRGGLMIGASRDLLLEGELADIRIYRRALDQSQITSVARLRRHAGVNPAEVTHRRP